MNMASLRAPTGVGRIMQMAWITPDLDRSLGQFKEIYGIGDFFVLKQSFQAEALGKKGEISIKFALANIEDMQLELIQPLGGVDSIYRDVLPTDGRHANVFHHVCVKIEGTLADWDAYVAGLGPNRPVVLTGDVGPGARFMYTDERDKLGIFVEHLWFGPELESYMAQNVPTYQAKYGRRGK
ncbi:MAG: VOC family protein [Sinobacteraceae bacterium]|nr:VOC family protein [Nevskiaceae bacterium]